MNDEVGPNHDKDTSGRIDFLSVPGASEKFQGLLGLAPASESSGPLLVSQLFNHGKLSADEFSIQLAPNPPSRDPSLGSFLTFGGLHPTLKANDPKWISHRIAGSFHWQAKFNSIKYDGKVIRPQSSVILTDTGTTMSYLLAKEFNELMPLVCPDCKFNTANQLYQLSPCNAAE